MLSNRNFSKPLNFPKYKEIILFREAQSESLLYLMIAL